MASLGLFLRLPEATVDLTSWNHWRMPSLENGTLPTEETFGPGSLRLNTKSHRRKQQNSSEPFADTQEFGVATEREDGVSTVILRTYIGMSKRLSSHPGRNICANTIA